MAQGMELARELFDELRAIKYGEPYQPTAEVNMVWSVSAPGTALQPAPKDNPVYGGEKTDLTVIKHALSVIDAVAAVRLKKEPGEIDSVDRSKAAPSLYYNGEDADTEGVNYHQNDALRMYMRQPGFPLAPAKVIIDKIPHIGTHFQVEGILGYIERTGFTGEIAVAALITQSVRIGRYLELQRQNGRIPENVKFVSAPAPITTRTFAKVRSEVNKTLEYAAKGDTAETNYFFQQQP